VNLEGFKVPVTQSLGGDTVNLEGFKVPVIVFTAILSLLVLLGSVAIYERTRAAEPLDESLAADPQVSDYFIDRAGKKWIITITLDPTCHLPTVYRHVEEEARRVLGERPCRIVLTDARTAGISDFYDQVHPYLYEGAATGEFGLMAERVRAAAADGTDLAVEVAVDDRYVYLTVVAGDGHLHSVIERPMYGEGAAS